MNNIFKLGLGLLFASLPFTSISADIKLEYGINLIDFNGDGIPDVVVKSQRSLNDSPSIDMVTVYIKGSDQKVYIVPSIYANALSLYNNKITGTDITISDFKFIEKKDKVVLLSAEKVEIIYKSLHLFVFLAMKYQKRKKRMKFSSNGNLIVIVSLNYLILALKMHILILA
ncbi:hypothetical protein AB6H17_07535 [Proteus vulgaris]|uniref:carbapenem self-resistance protein CarG family protein n=1 Tax=Proteus vulgaris TaxID=585 RepID=UPI0034DD12B7